MERILEEILSAIRAGDAPLDDAWLNRALRRANRGRSTDERIGKRQLRPFYLELRERGDKRWRSWEVTPAEERAILRFLQMKPRRTASGVATVTVLTRPHPCSSDCIYCPSDVRMPKSYLSSEPACQRAEQNFFDPYLQVRSRLATLQAMGHLTDKIELIVLGGTWSDYPESYRIWFVRELFRALNEAGSARAEASAAARRELCEGAGMSCDQDAIARSCAEVQARVDAGELGYNEAARKLYGTGPWAAIAPAQSASWEELEREHAANEDAACRCVGLCIETRPDLIDDDSAREMRRLGCTKVQMGIQSLNEGVLAANGRRVSARQIERAFAALRLAGFKIMVHMMANLLGSTPEADRADYARLVFDPRFMPDEVKLYPCALVESSRLRPLYEAGLWRPYTDEELVRLLADDVAATPAWTRISRMIRDISTDDIIAGSKRPNLRQEVERRRAELGLASDEIRQREVATADVDPDALALACVPYETAVADERFLQWVTPEGHIAGFLRLSLPAGAGAAMIREVHVYGRVEGLVQAGLGSTQHAGLGRALVERACELARDAGYTAIDVISAVGTRAYYRRLGFADAGLYQRREL